MLPAQGPSLEVPSRGGHTARPLSQACVCCSSLFKCPWGPPPSAGRNSLSPRPAFKGPLHEGPFCLPMSQKDPTLGLTAGRPDAAGHKARAECQSSNQRPWSEFPLTPKPAHSPWQACWEAAPSPSPVRVQLRRHTHPALVPTRPADPPVTVPTPLHHELLDRRDHR